jgi:hypothetical protein
MTRNGYNWCDHCDENAFAAKVCPTCQRPTRFVLLEPTAATQPAPKIPAHEWFRRMREAVENVKPT